MEGLTPLAQYGLTGISIALIILVGFIIGLVFKFMGNHIKSNTKATQELIDVIKEIKEYLIFRNKK